VISKISAAIHVSGRDEVPADETLISHFVEVLDKRNISITDVELGEGPDPGQLLSAVTIQLPMKSGASLSRTYVFSLERSVAENLTILQSWLDSPSVLENAGSLWSTLPPERKKIEVKRKETVQRSAAAGAGSPF